MAKQSRITSHGLRIAAAVFAVSTAAGAAFADSKPIGFVSGVKGKPAVQSDSGERIAVKPLQKLTSGTLLVLSKADSVSFCHEGAGSAFKVEGAGVVNLGEAGLAGQTPGLTVTQTGPCGTSVAPRAAGGIILRSLAPPKPAQ